MDYFYVYAVAAIVIIGLILLAIKKWNEATIYEKIFFAFVTAILIVTVIVYAIKV